MPSELADVASVCLGLQTEDEDEASAVKTQGVIPAVWTTVKG